MNITEAFEALLGSVNDELEKTQQAGADYFARGELLQVRKIADRMEELQSLMAQVHELQSKWQELFPEPEPEADRAHKGTRTKEKYFRLPILQALVELGGEGAVEQVTRKVEKIMAGVLSDDDYLILPSGEEVRWRNTTKWERWSMVQDGLLSKNAPHGRWRITEAGRDYLKKADISKKP